MKQPLLSAANAVSLALAFAAAFSLPLAAQLQPTPAPNAAPSPEEPRHSRHKPPPQAIRPQPATVIPVAPLGFAPPALYYLGDHISQASLNFLTEDALLFTFRVPGLIPRDAALAPSAQASDHDARNIRALVLELPSGRITAEALWRLHDFAPYLWPLRGQRFLLRDLNTVEIGDAGLHLTPFLRFPGHVHFLELDPAQRLLVADTSETPASDSASATSPKAGPGSGSVSVAASNSSDPSTSSVSLSLNGHVSAQNDKSPAVQNLLRILRMENRTVKLFSRVPGIVHLPLDGDGYYEALRAPVSSWDIVYNPFGGPATPLARVESACSPSLDVPAAGVVLVSACTDLGGRKLTAFARDWEKGKNRLWEKLIPPTFVWPLLAHAADAPRIARATLEVNHSISPTSPLDSNDIRAQSVEVYDLADGKVELSLPVTPILDAGGNFALSPSGNRFAVLNGGQIQIYNLPPAPPIPSSAPLPARPPKKN